MAERHEERGPLTTVRGQLTTGFPEKILERDPTLDLVRADLDRARAEVLDAVESLRLSLRDKLDWRAHVRARPARWLLGGFALGWVLGRVR